MYGSRMWANLFTQQPQTVLGAYTQASDQLNNARQQQIATALQQIKLNAAPTLMQQAEDQGTAKTSLMQNAAQYAPQLSALDVQQKQILNAMNSTKFQEMPQEFQQGMALKAAQIQEIKQKMALAPQQLAQQQGRFGAPYQLQKILSTLSPAAKAAFISANPNVMNQIFSGALNNAASAYNPSAQQQNISQNNIMPNTINSQQNIAPVIPQQQNQQSQPQLPFAIASQIAANKGSVTSPTTKRLESAIEIEKILNDPSNDELAANAAKYAGIGGKISGGLQALSSSNPKEYEDYLQFKNQFGSMITNIMRQVEGLGVQESTREELRGNLLKEFDSLSGNPARALDQYNRLKTQMTQLARAASTAAQPIYPGVREKQAGINLSEPKNNQMVQMLGSDGKTYNIPADKVDDAISNFKMKRAS